MRRQFLAVVAFPLVALAGGRAADATLDGTWEGFAVDGKGEKPNDGPVHLRLEVKDGKMTATDLRAKKSLGEGTFELDAKAGRLDATGTVLGAGKARPFLGIYQLDGDTLKWCVSNRAANGRPAEFVTKAPNYLLVLRRQKP